MGVDADTVLAPVEFDSQGRPKVKSRLSIEITVFFVAGGSSEGNLFRPLHFSRRFHCEIDWIEDSRTRGCDFPLRDQRSSKIKAVACRVSRQIKCCDAKDHRPIRNTAQIFGRVPIHRTSVMGSSHLGIGWHIASLLINRLEWMERERELNESQPIEGTACEHWKGSLLNRPCPLFQLLLFLVLA